MPKLVLTVFKVLGISIILMLIFDTSLVVMDTLSVHNKVTSISTVMQNEISRNNCVPNGLQDLFKGQLNKIVVDSNVATKVGSNLNGSLKIGNTTYSSLAESNVGNYGDIKNLAISITMSPTRVLYVRNRAKSGGTFLTKSRYTYNMTYVYSVPCLRYLK